MMLKLFEDVGKEDFLVDLERFLDVAKPLLYITVCTDKSIPTLPVFAFTHNKLLVRHLCTFLCHWPYRKSILLTFCNNKDYFTKCCTFEANTCFCLFNLCAISDQTRAEEGKRHERKRKLSVAGFNEYTHGLTTVSSHIYRCNYKRLQHTHLSHLSLRWQKILIL